VKPITKVPTATITKDLTVKTADFFRIFPTLNFGFSEDVEMSIYRVSNFSMHASAR